ncbi:TRAP-type C4-dicarboxylate transport system substrate-binding protein [Amorphus suaedae]
MSNGLSRNRAALRGGLLALATGLALAGLAAAAQAEPVKLVFATGIPPQSPIVKDVMEPWAAEANAASEGEYEIEVVNGFALANNTNMIDRVKAGVVDIGFALHGASGLPFDKTMVVSLPLIVTDPVQASNALWKLYADGVISDEYPGVKVIGLVALPIQGISSSKPIESLDDIAGMKIRAVDKVAADAVSALGASPIALPTNEVYQSLDRGVVDGAVVNWLMVGAFNVGEVAQYHQRGVPLGAVPSFFIMNEASYAKLSPKGREIFDKHIGAYLSRYAGEGQAALAGKIEKGLESKSDQHIVELSADQRKKWEEKLQPVIDQWVERTPNGAEVLADFQQASGSK